MKIPKNIKLTKISNKGKGVVLRKNIKKNEIVLRFNEGIAIKPNVIASKTAIQIDEDSFLDSNTKQIRDFLNHSCTPNIKINFEKMAGIAIKNIKSGEEITFDYFSTEYDLKIKNENFKCECGSANCRGMVNGFKHLNKIEKLKIKKILTPFLLRKITK